MYYTFLRFPGGKAKAVTFSYDDGCRQDIRMSQIITQHGFKCTFNINSRRFGQTEKGWNMTADEIRKYFIEAGHEIAVHGAYHQAPGLMRPIAGIQDVLTCRKELEQEFGFIIRGMAYPDSGIRHFENQASYEDIRHYLKDLDIVYSRTLGGDNNRFELPCDWYAWMPTAHHDNPLLFDYIDEFVKMDLPAMYEANRTPKLFYLWGHSFEFDNNNNWERLDQICEKLGNKDDIWYATNMEIYNYVQAYNSLIFSVDASMIHNPTLIDVWVLIDDDLICIKSGDTVIR